MSTNKISTVAGIGALIIWSFSAIITTSLNNLPPFEITSLIFGTSFLGVSLKLSYCREWHKIRNQPWALWVFGVIGLCGSDYTYVKAIEMAPPEHIDLIDYLWPFLVIVFTSFLPQEKFSYKYLIAGFFGLGGIYVLLGHGQLSFDLDRQHILGYSIAFLGALAWSDYIIVTRFYQQAPAEMIGMYCGVGFIISILAHFRFEQTVIPTGLELILAMTLGLGASGVAYLLWDLASKQGNIRFLGTLTYFTPILSMGLLVYFDKAPLTYSLVLACGLVILGVIIGSLNWQEIAHKLGKQSFK